MAAGVAGATGAPTAQGKACEAPLAADARRTPEARPALAATTAQDEASSSHGDEEALASSSRVSTSPGSDNLRTSEDAAGTASDDTASVSTGGGDAQTHKSLGDDASVTSGADDEPAFHLDALGASVNDIVARDSISAMAVCYSYVALGMHSGMIYVLTREGHLEKVFRFHSAAVLDLVFDTHGEFVGSAGMDGMVAIASLSGSEQYQFDFRRPMRTIALEPQFGRRSSRAFVCGGLSGVLVHREKRWFGHREVVVHADEGPIWATAWHGRWLAWANDRGVRIADAATHEIITHISVPGHAPRAELARCTLRWRDHHTLVIAQGDRITIASVRTREAAASDELRASIPSVPTISALVSGLAPAPDAPKHYVEITDIFQLDCIVSSVALWQHRLVTLTYVVDDDVLAALDDPGIMARPGEAPELRVVSRHGEELSSDCLPLDGAARFRCNDYHLHASYEMVHDPVLQDKTQQPLFFVASPRQVYRLRPRDARDHIEWLLARDEYREALEALEALGSGPAAAYGFDVRAVSRDYLTHIMDVQHDYEGAAELLPLLLRADVAAWDTVVQRFVEHDQVRVLLPHLPIRDPELSESTYNSVLEALLHTDQALLLTTLRSWPGHLYNTAELAARIKDQAPTSRVLLECLAQLFLADHRPGEALMYLLRLRHPSVFGLIRDNDLLIDVQHKLGDLVELDQDLAGTATPSESVLVALLVDHTHTILIDRAMRQLAPYPWYQYLYLDALFERDAALVTDYAQRLVELYSDYAYPKLMPFLRAMSSVYSFKHAYSVCESHNYVPEMVFLRGRTGDLRGALNLILERLDDADLAIDFVRRQDDIELWEALLHHALNRPEYIRGLLEQAGGEINPVRLIRPIRNGLVIPGLRPALIKILQNFQLQNSLLRGGLVVAQHDTDKLAEMYSHALVGGLACDGTYHASLSLYDVHRV